MASMSCQVQTDQELTVGKVFSLTCQGEWPKMNIDRLELLVDKENQYKLKLLGINFKSPTEAELQVTSYEVGEHQIKAVQLADSENSVLLGDLQFKVVSVQKPEAPVQEPLGPTGALSLQIALIYWLLMGGLAGVVGLTLGYRTYQRRQKQRLLKAMNLDQYATSPLQQFYASTRKLQRTSLVLESQQPTPEALTQFIADLENIFRLYMARIFQVPAKQWSVRRIISDLRRYHAESYVEFRQELKKLFSEFERARQLRPKHPITQQDCIQLFAMTRQLVEKMDGRQHPEGRR